MAREKLDGRKKEFASWEGRYADESEFERNTLSAQERKRQADEAREARQRELDAMQIHRRTDLSTLLPDEPTIQRERGFIRGVAPVTLGSTDPADPVISTYIEAVGSDISHLGHVPRDSQNLVYDVHFVEVSTELVDGPHGVVEQRLVERSTPLIIQQPIAGITEALRLGRAANEERLADVQAVQALVTEGEPIDIAPESSKVKVITQETFEDRVQRVASSLLDNEYYDEEEYAFKKEEIRQELRRAQLLWNKVIKTKRKQILAGYGDELTGADRERASQEAVDYAMLLVQDITGNIPVDRDALGETYYYRMVDNPSSLYLNSKLKCTTR